MNAQITLETDQTTAVLAGASSITLSAPQIAVVKAANPAPPVTGKFQYGPPWAFPRGTGGVPVLMFPPAEAVATKIKGIYNDVMFKLGPQYGYNFIYQNARQDADTWLRALAQSAGVPGSTYTTILQQFNTEAATGKYFPGMGKVAGLVVSVGTANAAFPGSSVGDVLVQDDAGPIKARNGKQYYRVFWNYA